jgi:glycerol kinase
MKDNAGLLHIELRADGGPTKNRWLMQRQADILNEPVRVSKIAELSAAGAAFMAGKALGVMDENVIEHAESRMFDPMMEKEERGRLYSGWTRAVEQLLK